LSAASTTVRDLGGRPFRSTKTGGLTKGLVPGTPNLFRAGAMITDEGGNGDMRPPVDLPANPAVQWKGAMERTGAGQHADSATEVAPGEWQRMQNSLQGDSQIKKSWGGGGGVVVRRAPTHGTC